MLTMLVKADAASGTGNRTYYMYQGTVYHGTKYCSQSTADRERFKREVCFFECRDRQQQHILGGNGTAVFKQLFVGDFCGSFSQETFLYGCVDFCGTMN